MMMDHPFAEHNGFSIFPHGQRDMVNASAFNRYGNRFAIGSADGRIKVFDRNRDGSWVICDTWWAHKAEIVEV